MPTRETAAPRVIRPCVGCGQHDDHPRALHVLPGGVDVALFHYDCHALIDPTCELCVSVTEMSAGKTGDELITHLNTIREQ